MAYDTEFENDFIQADILMVAPFLMVSPIMQSVTVSCTECGNADCSEKCPSVALTIQLENGSLSMRFNPFKAELLAQDILAAVERQKKMLTDSGYASLDDFLAKSKPHD